jgi:hypothetical protein
MLVSRQSAIEIDRRHQIRESLHDLKAKTIRGGTRG